GMKFDQVSDLAAEAYEKTHCPQPIVRADWFVLAVTRSPLGEVVNKGKPIQVSPALGELLKQVDRTYNRELEPAVLACELGLSNGGAFSPLLNIAGPFQPPQSLSERKPIRRETWESKEDGLSLFQRTAQALQLGTPFRQL